MDKHLQPSERNRKDMTAYNKGLLHLTSLVSTFWSLQKGPYIYIYILILFLHFPFLGPCNGLFCIPVPRHLILLFLLACTSFYHYPFPVILTWHILYKLHHMIKSHPQPHYVSVCLHPPPLTEQTEAPFFLHHVNINIHDCCS